LSVYFETPRRGTDVRSALRGVSQLVDQQNAGDRDYLIGQLHRFEYTATRIQALCPTPCRVLDVGSHYLHQAMILRLLGYDVVGVDVPLFSRADFVTERSTSMGIRNVTIDSLEDGRLLVGEGLDGTFDLIVFTAILEHITFNPVRFWRRIYDLMTPNGRILVTTPNGLRPAAFIRQVGRLLTLRGVGLPVADVLGTITYGHHWKEYSRAELTEYFRLLSPDFTVSTRCYVDAPRRASLRGALARVASVMPFCRPELEAVVSLSGKSGAIAAEPQLPMARRQALRSERADATR
jgi:SAM-dependent methyltransferase